MGDIVEGSQSLSAEQIITLDAMIELAATARRQPKSEIEAMLFNRFQVSEWSSLAQRDYEAAKNFLASLS